MRNYFILIICSFLAMHTSVFAQTYRLQEGDRIEITVFQDAGLNRQLIVGPDGRISFPLAGHLRAAGAPLESLERQLKGRLQKFYTEDLDVSVALIATAIQPDEELETNIYVTGEVRNPGQFVLRKRTTVLQAIALSGGLQPFASKTRIHVRRTLRGGDEEVLPFNYRDVETGRDLTGNVVLKEGDVIVVPEKGLFE